MLCPKCSAWIADDSAFCSKCGARIEQNPAVPPEEPKAPEPPREAAVPEESAPLPPPEPQPQLPPPHYQQQQYQQQSGQQIKQPPSAANYQTYLTQNILLTVFGFLCFPFGLPTAVTGLVFSAIAQSALKQNNFERVAQNVKLAKIFMWISFGLEIATLVFSAIFLPDFISGILNREWPFMGRFRW